jgi:hypothetical protein
LLKNLSREGGRGTLEECSEAGDLWDVELQIDVAAQVAATETAEERVGKIPNYPAEKQRATKIRGALDNKEEQCGESERQDRLCRENDEQTQTGGRAAAKESGKEGEDQRDKLPPQHCALSIRFAKDREWLLETARPGLCDPGSCGRVGANETPVPL